ncbi:hypothetical protein [Halomonas sp. BM-2019]|uniref:hypothetical protein n=1 Tax=Halomonas sp. BM-2019 TaxID=2811227 RepID=UPI001B3C460F|nr:MAG: hypothetical protein J5F18_18695 [Halomonas sp. BM-2019]
MTALAVDMPRCQDAHAGATVRGVASTGGARGGWYGYFWHGYFMTGVPAAMSD